MFAPKASRMAGNSGSASPARRTPPATARSHSADHAGGVSWNLSHIRVGAVNDPLEHAANRAADSVMPAATPSPSSGATRAAGFAQGGGSGGAVESALQSPGRPLDAGVRSFMESRLGHDFSGVRLHDDAPGAAAADSLKAQAFTLGRHIAFSGTPNFSSPQGRHLLAHELAHVAQQSTMGSPMVQRQPKQTQAQAQPQQSQTQPTGPQLPQPIVALLQQTSEGQWALNNLTTYHVTLILSQSGRPAFYDANGNSCTVNVALPAGVVASYFIHEMFHAQQERTGKSGDAKKMDKRAFVGTMVNEEIAGTVKGYQAYMELEQKGQIPQNVARPPRYDSFKSAYQTGREREQKANPTASEADLQKAGLKNAEAAVRWYVNEGGLGPFQGVTYSEYYGEEWKKAQKKP